MGGSEGQARTTLLEHGLRVLRGNQVTLTMRGEFNARAEFDRNLINAPVSAFRERPPDLPIDQEMLDALNRESHDVVEGFIGEQQIELATAHSAGSFLIDVRLNGNNRLGGNYHGLQIEVKVNSVEDRDVIYGRGRSRVAIARHIEAQIDNLMAAFEWAFDESVSNFAKRLTADSRPPRCELILAVDVSELDEAQRLFVETGMLPCLVDLGRSLDAQPIESDSGQLRQLVTYRLQLDDPDETEDTYLEWYAHRIERGAGAHGKHRCSLWKTPLAGYTARTRIDTSTRQINVWWEIISS